MREGDLDPLTALLYFDEFAFHPIDTCFHCAGHFGHLLGGSFETSNVVLESVDRLVLVSPFTFLSLLAKIPLNQIVAVVAPVGLDLTMLERKDGGDCLVE